MRIVAATNEDLAQGIRENRFREDLYHRLAEFEIHLPALRECRADILPLAGFFRERFSSELRKPTEGFTPEAEERLLSYPWPGNIREMQNRVRRAVLLAESRWWVRRNWTSPTAARPPLPAASTRTRRATRNGGPR